jgi:hypothetical protein
VKRVWLLAGTLAITLATTASTPTALVAHEQP